MSRLMQFSPAALTHPMKKPRRNRSLVVALYLNAALLTALFAAVISRGSGTMLSTASASLAPQPIAGGGSLYLMPAQLLSNVWGCYVMDIDNQTLCAYAFNGNQLRLMCARSIRYDHELRNHNTSPDPEEIRRLVELEKGKVRGIGPADEAPPTQPSSENR